MERQGFFRPRNAPAALSTAPRSASLHPSNTQTLLPDSPPASCGSPSSAPNMPAPDCAPPHRTSQFLRATAATMAAGHRLSTELRPAFFLHSLPDEIRLPLQTPPPIPRPADVPPSSPPPRSPPSPQ